MGLFTGYAASVSSLQSLKDDKVVKRALGFNSPTRRLAVKATKIVWDEPDESGCSDVATC